MSTGHGQQRGARKGRDKKDKSEESMPGDLLDRVVKIKRCAAVVKGGRRFSFAAMVVVGDGKGKVGWGYGKANEVPPSVSKAQKQASRSMIDVPLVEGTIPHQIWGHFGAARVVLLPAGAGTGIIAGQAVRSVCEACGVHDILTKSFGTNNPVTLVKATIDAMSKLRTRQQVEALRGVELDSAR
jgi:small subunit ribosomal protein S5